MLCRPILKRISLDHSIGIYYNKEIWGFPKIMGTIIRVPIIRIIIFWGLHWGPPILGNYHMKIKPKDTTDAYGQHVVLQIL